MPRDMGFLEANNISLEEIVRYKAWKVLDKVYIELYVRRVAIGEPTIDLFHNHRYIRTL